MHIAEQLRKPLREANYLNVENTDRYRPILRLFYLQYERMKYWLFQEDVYEELKKSPYFTNYTMEQCQQDLTTLTEWGNLVTIQDSKNVKTLEEFKNRKYQYQLSEYTVEIERMVIHLENLFVEGASLEPTLLERIKEELSKFPELQNASVEQTYSWWQDLENDFVRLNQNYQDYMRALNSARAEELMRAKEFLVFKDHLIEYLRTFVKALQLNVMVIENYIKQVTEEQLSEMSNMGANRREEYYKVAEMFAGCRDVNEAHRLAACVFGIENTLHLRGDMPRDADSMNSSIFDDQPYIVALKPIGSGLSK